MPCANRRQADRNAAKEAAPTRAASHFQSEALRESIRLDHSTYDTFHFVLARRTGETPFAADCKLAELCLGNGVDCVAEFVLPE